jgi:hypothetical protein
MAAMDKELRTDSSSKSFNTPFIIGVTGHRELDPQGILHLREAVTNFVRLIKEHLPDTEVQIKVGMAEGADLLVAQTALELGVRVNAVFPMPLDDYEADFDAESFALLKTLLKHPDVHTDELLSYARTLDIAAAAGPPAHRDSLYANLMETLIRRSSVLLALWDGKTSARTGGTADTVLRYLGLRTETNKHDTPIEFVDDQAHHVLPGPLVYWIPTARTGDPAPTQQPAFLSGLGDNGLQRHLTLPTNLALELAELNEYNRVFEKLASSDALHEPHGLMAAVPAELPVRDPATLEQIDTQYCKADALAVYYQKRSDRLFKFFTITTFAMAAAYLSYERLTESRLLLYAYLLILLSGIGLYVVLHSRRWFAKHLTYRVLAETMRAKFFLTVSGANHLVDAQEVLSLSGIDRFHGFGWINYVLRGVEPVDRSLSGGREPGQQEVSWVVSAWIQDQQSYFDRKVASLERNRRRIGRFKNVLIVVILLVMLVLIVFGEILHHTQFALGVSFKNLLTFSMGITVVLFGVWEMHYNKMATRELLWQYRNQLTHFSRASTQLSLTTASGRRKQIIAELGKDSLMESCLWTIHRYHREHEPPATT